MTRRRANWWSRLCIVALLVALASLAACGDDDDGAAGGEETAAAETSAKPGEGKKVAFIGIAPVDQGNWDPAGYQAFTKMAEKYGFEASNQEGVGYDQAAAVLRRLAPENDLIVAHSGGYAAAVLEVAPEFPDTMFVVFADLASTEGNENVAGWVIDSNQTGYLAGTTACLAAQERGANKVGYVNSVPIPAFTKYAASVRDAAKELGCDFTIRWTNSFSDVAKAKQAALSMIDDGAEVLISSADTADAGSREGVVEADKLYVALFVDTEVDLAPDNTITAVHFDFDGAYDQIGKLFAAGDMEAKTYPVTVTNGMVDYVTPFRNVGKEVEEKSVAVQEQIESGELEVPQSKIEP
jgi:basic membrane protein A and related proteins